MRAKMTMTEARERLNARGFGAAVDIYTEEFEGRVPYEEGVVRDMVGKLLQYGSLSERQYEYLGVLLGKIADRANKPESPSNYVGEVGKRGTFTATVVFAKEYEARFGMSTLTIMVDKDGNKMKWWGRGFYGADKGATVVFKGTPKKHELYDGEKVTMMTRCSEVSVTPAEPEPEPAPVVLMRKAGPPAPDVCTNQPFFGRSLVDMAAEIENKKAA